MILKYDLKVPIFLFLSAVSLLLLVLSVPIHEIGHALICRLHGSHSYIQGVETRCIPDLKGMPKTVNKYFGGLFSAIILSLFLFIFQKFTKYRYILLQIFLPVILFQLINSLLEGGFTSYYIVLRESQIFVLLLFILLFLINLTVFYNKFMRELQRIMIKINTLRSK